ncbi:hypothetical protein [Curtobacterium sp. PhB115]|uniref:hypothetical protein n=1 Tax=Curtobacterium sp. PhB115 TaxID=2485173 RepID=UPI000F4B4313|nr:hypothetical protein [Curtobacterium sp. PhB115]ROP72412.1 hypothetical protein EDF19_1427 [Curtobacterium sp. PhB115]
MTADTMSVPTTRSAVANGRIAAARRAEAIRASRPFHADVERAPRWMRVLGGVLLAGGLALAAAVLGWPGDAPETALIVPALVAVVAGVLLLSARAGFAVSETHVTLHFRPLPPRRIARRRIADVRLVEADASTYGGVGLRLGRGVRALILTPGLGIEFTDDRGRVTFVRTRRPEDAFRALAGQQRRPGGTDHVERERIG